MGSLGRSGQRPAPIRYRGQVGNHRFSYDFFSHNQHIIALTIAFPQPENARIAKRAFSHLDKLTFLLLLVTRQGCRQKEIKRAVNKKVAQSPWLTGFCKSSNAHTVSTIVLIAHEHYLR